MDLQLRWNYRSQHKILTGCWVLFSPSGKSQAAWNSFRVPHAHKYLLTWTFIFTLGCSSPHPSHALATGSGNSSRCS